jgi:RNA polymerase sigma-70 factor (ECF subfamily)
VSSVDDAMSRYAQGHAEAFEVVYDTVAPRLDGYLRRHLRQPSQAQDIIQQTFLQMHVARGTFIIGAAVLPWAFAIARRLMIDVIRRTRREEPFDMDENQPSPLIALASAIANGEEALTAHETEARLSTAYERLSEPQRAAYDLVKTEGMSHADAACILGTTVTAIKLRVHRVYLALRAALNDGAAQNHLSPARDPR